MEWSLRVYRRVAEGIRTNLMPILILALIFMFVSFWLILSQRNTVAPHSTIHTNPGAWVYRGGEICVPYRKAFVMSGYLVFYGEMASNLYCFKIPRGIKGFGIAR